MEMSADDFIRFLARKAEEGKKELCKQAIMQTEDYEMNHSKMEEMRAIASNLSKSDTGASKGVVAETSQKQNEAQQRAKELNSQVSQLQA